MIFGSKNYSALALTSFLFLNLAWLPSAGAQQPENATETKAAVVIDIQVSELLSNKAARPLIDQFGPLFFGRQFDAKYFENVKRIRFVAGADKFLSSSQHMMARLQFINADAAAEFGKTMYPRSESTEGNAGWTVLSESRAGNRIIRYRKEFFEIGSPDFCNSSDESLLTAGLRNSLAQLDQSAAVNVAVETQAIASHYETLSKQFRVREGAVTRMFDRAFLFNEESMLLYGIECLQDISMIAIQADLDSNQLAKLVIKPTEGKTELTEAKVDVLLGFLMAHCELPLRHFKKTNPPAANVLEKALAGVKQGNEDGSIFVSMDKPKDFDKSIALITQSIQSSFAEKKDANRLKQLALSIHNYHDAMRKFPFFHDTTQRVCEDLSWRVKLLPFLEQSRLYRRIQLDKPWDAMENRFVIQEAEKLFTLSNGAMICGIECDPPVKNFGSILDGSSNTIMLIENRRASMTPWTKPNDLTIDQAVKLVKAIRPGKFIWVAFYDGSVRKLSCIEDFDLTDEDIRAGFNPRDGYTSRLMEALESQDSQGRYRKSRPTRRFEAKESDFRPREFREKAVDKGDFKIE